MSSLLFITSNHHHHHYLNSLCSSRYFYSNSCFRRLGFLFITYRRINPKFSSSQSRSISSSSSCTFMEVVKGAIRQGSAARKSIALRVEQKSYTYADLISSAWKVSNLLCDGVSQSTSEGIKGTENLAGARVGIVAKPSAEFVASMLGTWLSGGVAVPLALSYPETELLHVMNDSDVFMLLSTEDHQELMKNVAAKSSAQFSLIPSISSVPLQTSTHEHSHIEEANMEEKLLEEIENSKIIKGEDPALIVYTSGTTGKPKGVVHTHKSISSQVQILTDAWEYTSSDQFLHCLPLHHVHGLFNSLLAPLYAGAVVEFMPKFSVRGIWQRWRESYPKDETKVNDAITVFTGVPTMYTRLLQGYDAMEPELQATSASAASKLRLMMCGSSALPYPVMQQWESITGHRLLERYGMTEFVMALSNPLRGMRKGGTVGKPFPGVQVKILSEDESESDAVGVGELCVNSPSLFKEYWKQPQITKESFIDGGFFKTGDTVRVDEDGYFVILGHIMKVGGYKLSALDIEAVLLEHPVVSECCVLGLPDKAYGEAVCAIIVPSADAKNRGEEACKPAITLEELQTWAKEKLAPYKIPTRLFLWESLPRNAMGKVNKKELKKNLQC
ncbi:hypothetical protein AQUCO_00100399v1 [Aquilegia coerulea]|uniref:AMP-dependent synthetase/ligase domain-containing protein n=1 Tax=Aquilegia coerulea TaxID=218851 RepID=A0A2G5FA64_AQUCA|nr:hypothetical protein AQUCO_00100399v1 [Aquilegia coerulea]